MSSFVFPDNTVLINFAIVGRLDLLKTYASRNTRVVEAVAREIQQSAAFVTELSEIDLPEWFGEAIRIEDAAGIASVESMRTARFGGEKTRPTQHLGESQTIYVVTAVPAFADSIMLTDDRDAYRVARKLGVVVRHTVEVLTELVARHELSAADALDLVEAMLDSTYDRSLIDPPTTVKFFG